MPILIRTAENSNPKNSTDDHQGPLSLTICCFGLKFSRPRRSHFEHYTFLKIDFFLSDLNLGMIKSSFLPWFDPKTFWKEIALRSVITKTHNILITLESKNWLLLVLFLLSCPLNSCLSLIVCGALYFQYICRNNVKPIKMFSASRENFVSFCQPHRQAYTWFHALSCSGNPDVFSLCKGGFTSS